MSAILIELNLVAFEGVLIAVSGILAYGVRLPVVTLLAANIYFYSTEYVL